MRDVLQIPDRVIPVAYLCLGYVSRFDVEPELALKGWEQRLRLSDVVHFDRYGATDPTHGRTLTRACLAASSERSPVP